MIDYISILIKLPHQPLPAGKVLSLDADGEQEWCSPKSFQFSGSHESKMSFRSQGYIDGKGRATELFVTGNPSKFLQGHNVFGHDNLHDLMMGVFRKINDETGFYFDLIPLLGALHSAVVSRIDYTRSIQFENRRQAETYISQLSLRAHHRSGGSVLRGHSLYFNQSSRRWSIVVYAKGQELDKHRLHPDFKHRNFIYEQADNLVRVELRLKTLELKDCDCRKLYQLTPEKLTALYQERLERIQMNTIAELPTETISTMKPCFRSTYLMWKEGVNVQAMMKSPTFYRHASALRKLGVDISVPYSGKTTAKIIPLTTAIEGKPYQTPDFAYEQDLVFKPQPVRLVSIK